MGDERWGRLGKEFRGGMMRDLIMHDSLGHLREICARMSEHGRRTVIGVAQAFLECERRRYGCGPIDDGDSEDYPTSPVIAGLQRRVRELEEEIKTQTYLLEAKTQTIQKARELLGGAPSDTLLEAAERAAAACSRSMPEIPTPPTASAAAFEMVLDGVAKVLGCKPGDSVLDAAERTAARIRELEMAYEAASRRSCAASNALAEIRRILGCHEGDDVREVARAAAEARDTRDARDFGAEGCG